MAWRWYEMTDKNEVITIPDKGLEEAIKYELNLNPNCEITKDNIKSLRWLDASNKGILDLTGLDNAINLEELYLGYNQIEDISTLSELTNLKILNLSNEPTSLFEWSQFCFELNTLIIVEVYVRSYEEARLLIAAYFGAVDTLGFED